MSANPQGPQDEASQFLDPEPPPLAANGLAWFLIALFTVAILVSAVLTVPETVTGHFTLAPLKGTDPVRAPRGGLVTQASAAEGAHVEQGTLLFRLRSSEIVDRSSEQQTRQGEWKGVGESLLNARRRYESESLAAAEELRRLEGRLAYLDRMLKLKTDQLGLTKEQAQRAQQLNDQGLASLNERADSQIRHAQTALELEQLTGERREAEAALAKLRHQEEARHSEHQELERGLREKLEGARIRVEGLSAELGEYRPGGELELRAPCAGTVLRVQARAAGAIVREGETLAEVVCAGEKMHAELAPPQGGLARIRPGQPVKLLYDAFPYQRYGVRHGKVRWTGPGGVDAKEASTFRVFVELEDQSVPVDGKPQPLLAGMGGTARVVVGRRSVLSYALAPLQALKESFQQ